MNNTQRIKQLEAALRQADKWIDYLENTIILQDNMLSKLRHNHGTAAQVKNET